MIYERGVKMGESKKKTGRIVLYCLLFIILFPILVVNLTLCIKSFTSDDVPDFMGYKPFIIGEVAVDGIKEGDLVICKEVDFEKLSKDDVNDVIIAFRVYTSETEFSVELQKIAAILENGSIVVINNQGEAGGPILFKDVEGIYVTRIAKLGDIALFMSQPIGIIIIIAVPLGIIFIFEQQKNKKMRKEYEEKLAQKETGKN